MNMICFLTCVACALGGDDAPVREQSAAFAEAFNRHDAAGVAALWAEEGEYLDPETGETVSGRQDLEAMYQEIFADRDGVHMVLTVDNVEFPTAAEAIESGRATITDAEGEEQTAYRAHYILRDSVWLLTQVREVEIAPPPEENPHLQQLAWLVGTWVDKDEDSRIQTTASWDRYKNFLTQKFQVFVEGQLDLEGRQVIGWDPIQEAVRSWVFDSDGGFGEGRWKKDGDKWIVETASTLSDGSRASSINIYTPVNETSYTWESTGREVDGEILPNIAPVTVERQEEAA